MEKISRKNRKKFSQKSKKILGKIRKISRKIGKNLSEKTKNILGKIKKKFSEKSKKFL